MEASTEQEPMIEERLAKLHAEMDVIIDKFIDERFAVCPGVPKETIRRTYCARAHDCKCEEFKIIQTAAALAKRQAEYGTASLPEG
jgi:hypothetical protein